jgi:threonine synthase
LKIIFLLKLLLLVRDSADLYKRREGEAQKQIVHRGLFVEPTSATVFATLEKVIQGSAADDLIILPLTGSGLKGNPHA